MNKSANTLAYNAANQTQRMTCVLCVCLLLPLAGCGDYIAGRDAEIQNSTRALEAARDDVARAKAYSTRGGAYADKARVSRKYKVPPTDEYERLFGLALKDHNEAVRLNPNSSEIYFSRANAFYDRGSWDVEEEKDGKPWLDLAALDFEKATEMNPGDYTGFDMLGLTHEENGEWDKAIRDYTRELALNPLGRRRLATAYCDWGFELQQQKYYTEAAVVFEKSTQFGTADDNSCRSEPYESLVRIYTSETHQYDKAWDVVRRALKAGRVIPLDAIQQLRKDSGRND